MSSHVKYRSSTIASLAAEMAVETTDEDETVATNQCSRRWKFRWQTTESSDLQPTTTSTSTHTHTHTTNIQNTFTTHYLSHQHTTSHHSVVYRPDALPTTHQCTLTNVRATSSCPSNLRFWLNAVPTLSPDSKPKRRLTMSLLCNRNRTMTTTPV